MDQIIKRKIDEDPGYRSTDAGPDWWTVSDDEIPMAVATACNRVVESATYRARMTQYTIAYRLYGNQWAASNQTGVSPMSSVFTSPGGRQHMNDNVIQSCIDTLMSRIAQNKPRPEYTSVGANYRIQKQAQGLNKFIDGAFYEGKAYEKGNYVFRDGCALGDGFLHAYIDAQRERVAYERVAPVEILIDEHESAYAQPRQLHRVKEIDRRVALAAWPESAEAIRSAPQVPQSSGANGRISDTIIVRESWHLRSGPRAKDGLHVLTLESTPPSAGLLVKEDWELDRFPFARFFWCPRMGGYWSQGLPEQVQGLQIALNRINYTIEKSHNHMGSYKVLLQNGSKIVKEHLRSEIAAIISYTGQKPDFVTPQIVQPELYAFRQTLIQEIQARAGVSELSTSSQKPEGLDSEPSLREFYSIESDRFKTVIGYYENMFLDLADLTVELVKRQAGRGSYRVQAPTDTGAEEIDFKDVNLKRDSCVLQCFPTSMLPRSPEGKLKFAQELAQAGYITPTAAKRLLTGIPDIEADRELDQAPEDVIRKALDGIMYDGVFVGPEVTDDLPLARNLCLKYLALARIREVEPEKLELFRRYLGQLELLAQAATPPPAPPAPIAPAGPPPAGPLPPPTSPLIPNAANPQPSP